MLEHKLKDYQDIVRRHIMRYLYKPGQDHFIDRKGLFLRGVLLQLCKENRKDPTEYKALQGYWNEEILEHVFPGRGHKLTFEIPPEHLEEFQDLVDQRQQLKSLKEDIHAVLGGIFFRAGTAGDIIYLLPDYLKAGLPDVPKVIYESPISFVNPEIQKRQFESSHGARLRNLQDAEMRNLLFHGEV